MPSGTRWLRQSRIAGMPSGLCDGVEGVTRKVREVIRAGADVIKIASCGGSSRRPTGPDAAELLRGGSRGDRADGGRSGRPVMWRARPRGDRAGGPCGGPLDRARHVPRRRGDRVMLERGTGVPTLTAGDTTQEMAADPRSPRRSARSSPIGSAEKIDAFRRAGRGRRPRRDGDGLPGGPPRHEPARARADGRERPDARAGAGRRDLERRGADGAGQPARDGRAGQGGRRGPRRR